MVLTLRMIFIIKYLQLLKIAKLVNIKHLILNKMCKNVEGYVKSFKSSLN